jgi:exodeoxyribonuclease V gamma subunit
MDLLAEVVKAPGLAPMEPEIIVVPSRGLERWVRMGIAERLGVAANLRFPFPRGFVEEAMTAVLGPPPEEARAFSPDRLAWSIAALLPELCAGEGFERLHRYLEGDAPGARRLALARALAETLDQYPIYRPDWALAWERGEPAEFQAELFRALVARHGAFHMAARARAFIEAATQPEPALAGLPRRVSLFGVAALPPLFVELLAALGHHTELHLFVLSPSREHWAEIRSRREITRAVGPRGVADPAAEEALLLTVGNPLLASLGRVGRDFQFVLESAVDYIEGEEDLYVEPTRGPVGATMLATIQSDILGLRHRSPRGRAGVAEATPRVLDRHDRSVAVHACHGPMREIEVLREQILGMREDDPSLEPRDIVVMTPDLEAYAPLVEAVFGVDARDAGHLPFRVAGRGLRHESAGVAAFFALLDAASGRVPASVVLELLAREPVRARFGIDEDELATVRRWALRANVRWGVDEAHRASFEQPRYRETTWRFGLDRLLLGYAMPGDGRALFAGALPFDELDAGDADLLGRFASFCEGFFDVAASVSRARPMDAWREALERVMGQMLADLDEPTPALPAIREALREMADAARAGGFTEALPLAAVRVELAARLEAPQRTHAFLSGGVTVCELLPMRSVPFRVVCLVGMSDEGFPRPTRPRSFDLMARSPRRGDPRAGDEDRYLFLEAILAARDRLVITFTGRRAHEDAPLPPSVVVGELLDVIDESFVVPADAPDAPGALSVPCGAPPAMRTRARVLVRHPLQPWSPENFRASASADARVFSFSERYLDGARALVEQGPRLPRAPLFRRRLTEPEERITSVTLEALTRFFANPMRALLKGRLGLRLDDKREVAAAREPMVLSPLDEHALGEDLLRRALAGEDLPAAYQALRASGALPLGAVGAARFERALPEIEAIAAAVRAHAGGARLPSRDVSLLVAGVRVTGRLSSVYPEAQVVYRFGRPTARAELALWIKHLALLAASGEGPRQSVLVGRDRDKQRESVVRFGGVPDPTDRIADLVRLYLLGQVLPLRFFPEASFAYAKAMESGSKDAAAAREAGRNAFAPRAFGGGAPSAAEDPYIARVLDGRDPTDPDLRLVAPEGPSAPDEPGFAELACAVFAPLLAHREGEREERTDAHP